MLCIYIGTVRENLNSLAAIQHIRQSVKNKHYFFLGEVLRANESIRYSIFECFSNFQIAKKFEFYF